MPPAGVYSVNDFEMEFGLLKVVVSLVVIYLVG